MNRTWVPVSRDELYPMSCPHDHRGASEGRCPTCRSRVQFVDSCPKPAGCRPGGAISVSLLSCFWNGCGALHSSAYPVPQASSLPELDTFATRSRRRSSTRSSPLTASFPPHPFPLYLNHHTVILLNARCTLPKCLPSSNRGSYR
jgi:hypothetical protein